MQIRGRIVEEQKNYYCVDTQRGIIQSTLKGILKKKNKRLYVGDIVTIEAFNSDDPRGIIRQLHTRRNSLKKPSVTNIDQVLLINTYKEPAIDIEFIDQFLFMSSLSGFSCHLIFNKTDLLTEKELAEQQEIIRLYKKIGYTCIQTSAVTTENLSTIIDLCKDSLSIFAGPSGGGKSTILARIFPDHEFRIGELSKHISRGKHTTTSTILLKLSDSGYIADTPGFSYMKLRLIPEEEVSTHFPDIASNEGQCKFNNCIHDNEPMCHIKDMVKSGEIAESRYENYLKTYYFMQKKRREYKTPPKDIL